MSAATKPHRARHWRTLDDGRIRCEVCPRGCTLRDGQAGLCVVRRRTGDELVLETYGRTSGFCADPIEKKPLYHYLPGSAVFSFGTVGCNLQCKFCQNARISRARRIDASGETASPTEIARATRDSNCCGVAFTYNEPTVFLEYATDVADACHELGLKTIAVTSGYVAPAARRDLYDHIDAANVDLKAFTEHFYRSMTGGSLEPVLDTLRYLCRDTSVWTEITTLLIPGYNDQAAEVGRMCEWIARELGPDVPVHFTAFHPAFRLLDVPPTPAESLRRAREIARACGLRFVYTGNVRDTMGSATICPSCQARLIAREYFDVVEYRLDAHGRCEACGAVIPGHFGAKTSTMGANGLETPQGNRSS